MGQLGYLTHLTSGGIYVRARWYFPGVGRWATREPELEEGPNLYCYYGEHETVCSLGCGVAHGFGLEVLSDDVWLALAAVQVAAQL